MSSRDNDDCVDDDDGGDDDGDGDGRRRRWRSYERREQRSWIARVCSAEGFVAIVSKNSDVEKN